MATNERSKNLSRIFKRQTLRKISLLGFTAFIATLVVRHVLTGEGGSASPEAYCPFGGLETLYRYISSGGSFVPHVHMSNLVVFIGVVATAVLARSGFCGWVCPLGFIQEMVTNLSMLLQKRFSAIRQFVRRVKKQGAFLHAADRYMRLLKYVVLAWALGGTAIFGVMVFRDYDPWAALISIAEVSLGPGLVVLAVMLVASFIVERPWCRYSCPLGAVSGLLAKLSPVYLRRSENLCKNCSVCTKSCPMGLPVHKATTIKSVDCIGCLECVNACPKAGALELKLGTPIVGS